MRYIPYQTPMYNGTSYQSVPTIGSIGGYGYPPNGYYNQYFNPYYLRQQQELERKRQLEEAKNQANIWVMLTQCRNELFGYDQTDEDIMDQIKSISAVETQINSDEEFMQKVREISQRADQARIQEQIMNENIKRQQQVMAEQPIENKSLYRWLHEDAQERYMEHLYSSMNSQNSTAELYDSNAYNNLLNTHDSVFNSLKRDVTIDDMEIQVSLPQKLKLERDIRRQKFAESIKRGMM